MFAKRFIYLCLLTLCFSPFFLLGKTEKISSKHKKLILKALSECEDPNYRGPKILHKKVNSPFPDKKEINEVTKDMAFYTLSLENFPLQPNQKFNLYQQDTIGNILKIAHVFVNKDSKIYLKKLIKGEKPISFENHIWGLVGALPGESFDYVLISSDGNTRASTHIIPRPIESQGSSEQKIKLELKSVDGSLFLLSGEKFKPNEELSFTSISGDEKRKQKLNADQDGKFYFFLLPQVVGKKNGKGIARIESSDGSLLDLRYVWGPDYVMKLRNCEISDFFKNS